MRRDIVLHIMDGDELVKKIEGKSFRNLRSLVELAEDACTNEEEGLILYVDISIATPEIVENYFKFVKLLDKYRYLMRDGNGERDEDELAAKICGPYGGLNSSGILLHEVLKFADYGGDEITVRIILNSEGFNHQILKIRYIASYLPSELIEGLCCYNCECGSHHLKTECYFEDWTSIIDIFGRVYYYLDFICMKRIISFIEDCERYLRTPGFGRRKMSCDERYLHRNGMKYRMVMKLVWKKGGYTYTYRMEWGKRRLNIVRQYKDAGRKWGKRVCCDPDSIKTDINYESGE